MVGKKILSLILLLSLATFAFADVDNHNCKTILDTGGSTGNGVYSIDPDGAGGNSPFDAYCDMTNDGGGWTLIMRTANDSTFGYNSSYWTSGTLLNENSFDPSENTNALYQAYNTVPFNVIRGCAWSGTSNCVIGVLSGAPSSMYSAMNSSFVESSGPERTALEMLFGSDSSQQYCNMVGLNNSSSYMGYGVYSSARFGLVGNNENDCGSSDSAWGWGVWSNSTYECGSGMIGWFWGGPSYNCTQGALWVRGGLFVRSVSPNDALSIDISNSQTFTCNASDVAGLSSINFYVYDSGMNVVHSDSVAVFGSSSTQSFNYTLPTPGSYYWKCGATGGSGTDLSSARSISGGYFKSGSSCATNNGYSFYIGNMGENCNTVCSTHGGTVSGTCTEPDPGFAACHQLVPGTIGGDSGCNILSEGASYQWGQCCNQSCCYAWSCDSSSGSTQRICACNTGCSSLIAVTLNTPYNNQAFSADTELTQTLSCDVGSFYGIQTATLHVRDSGLNEIGNVQRTLNNGYSTQTFNYTFPGAGTYSWTCEACNATEGCVTAAYNSIEFGSYETVVKTFADSRQKAYNTSSGSQPSKAPDDPAYTEYTPDQYTNATTEDSSRTDWHGVQEASSYANLLFKFTVDSKIKVSNIKELAFKWVGYDELSMYGAWQASTSNRIFKIYVWNFNSSSWEELYTTRTPQWSDQTYNLPIINGSKPTSGAVLSNYVGPSKEVYFSVSGDFYGGQYAGSCPYVFLYDGNQYNFHTDLMAGVLAKDQNIFNVKGYSGGPFSLEEFKPVNGVYKLKIRETIEEADYFDEAKLVLVDAPKGYDVMTRWYYVPETGQSTPKDYVTIKDPKAPISAIDKTGNDVLSEVLGNDEVPVALTSQNDKTQVIVDFGNIEHPEYAKLILTGWAQYVSRFNADKSKFSPNTTIETLNDKNEWEVRKVTIKNGGFKRSILLDIPNILKKNNTKVRITMANSPVELGILDQVLLDDSVPVDVSVKYVSANVANLAYGGAANYTYPTMTQGGSSDDTNNPVNPLSIMYGNFTKYGDVRPLLEKTDDKFVVMVSGDELQLEFNDPAKSVGVERHAFLYADVFYSIKSTVKRFVTDSIYPLPFHGMKSYSYAPSEWKYKDDADYKNYLDTWNTRTIDRNQGTHTMYENLSQLSIKYIPEYASSGTFISNKISFGTPKGLYLINFDADAPTGTTIKFQIRSANTSADLDTAPWLGPDGTGSTYYTTNNQRISLVHGNVKWAQWKAYLSTTISSVTPKVFSVELIVGNKIESLANFIVGDGTRTRWTSFTPKQYLNGGDVNWYYYTYNAGESCTLGSSWNTLTLVGDTTALSGQSDYLCLLARITPDLNVNEGPKIQSLKIGVSR